MFGDHVFKRFPMGLWWVAWIDHTLRKTKVVHVVLVPYDGDTVSIEHLERLRERVYVCQVDRAALPLLACGDVFFDRKRISGRARSSVLSVCDDHPFGTTRVFKFDTGVFARATEASRGLGIVHAFSSDGAQNAYRLYPLATTLNSKVLVVDAFDGCRYLIPAAEILRSLVAPQSRLLSSIFGENLFPFIDGMIDLSRSSFRADGKFDLVLKEEGNERFAYHIANMVRRYNPDGEAAITRLFSSVRDADPALSPQSLAGRLAYVRNYAALLPICFPFGAGRMTMQARCVVLGSGFFLVAKMLGGTWPPLPPLHVTLPAPEVDASLSPGFVPGQPGPPGAAPKGDVDGFDDIDLIEPPSTSGEPVAVPVERVHWLGLPEIEVHREKSSRAPMQATPVPERDLHGTAMGDADGSGVHHRGEADHFDREPPDRFRMTHDALDRLTAAGKIRGHDDVARIDIAGRPLVRVMLRGLSVWKLPSATTRSWTTLPMAGDQRRSRTLYLRRILLDDRGIVYWISIEVAGDETRYAVLIAFGERDVDPISEAPGGPLSRAIGALVAAQGRLSDRQRFRKAVDVQTLRFSLFRHSWGQFTSAADRAKAAQEDPPVVVPERFNDDRVVQALSPYLA